MNFVRLVGWMSVPTPILAAISPERAYRRLLRRAAWHIARPIRFGVHHAKRVSAKLRPLQAPTMTDAEAAARPINLAMKAEDVAAVKSWAVQAHEFIPGKSARILRDIDQNRPVGKVRDEFRGALAEVNELRAKGVAQPQGAPEPVSENLRII